MSHQDEDTRIVEYVVGIIAYGVELYVTIR